MNRLIILDNLHHGWVRLLVIGALYVGVIAPASAFLAEESLTSLPFFFLGFISMICGVWIRPVNSPVRNEMQLDGLLPISKTELVTTQWFLRTVYPAACLTLFFLVATLLGPMRAMESIMPAHLPVHLFAAYACGFSAVFFSSNLQPQYSGGKWRPKGGLIAFLAMLVPSIYLALVSTFRDNTTAASVLVVIALFIVVVTRRTICSRLVAPTFRRPPPDFASNTRLLAYMSKLGGFRQLALYMIKSSVLYLATFFPIVAFMLWLIGEPNLFSVSGMLASFLIPVSCALHILSLNQEASPNNLNSRALRTLPLTAGNLALRIIAVRCAGLTTGFLCLAPLFFWFYGTHMGLFLANVSFVCIASTSILTPFMLWIPSLWGRTVVGSICTGIVTGGILSVYQDFTEGSLTPLAIANLVGVGVLLGAWWILRALLCNSSRIYRPKAHEEFSV